MARIAIVGAGFSGTLLALHLLRRCPPGSKITLIERGVQFGRGAAYSTGNPNHLLNVPAGKMSAFHDRPHDFVEWLEAQADLPVSGPLTEGSFVPRQVFGNYVRHLLNQEIKTPSQPVSLELLKGDAQRIELSGDEVVIHLDRRRTLHADLAVLAVGNFPPESPTLADPGFYDTDFYRADPWAADTFTDLDPERPVLMIGTGLTMVDVAVSLLDRGHKGPIHALSRRGLRPQRHMPAVKAPTPRAESFPTDLVQLTAFMRRAGRRAAAEGADWRAIVDELRPFTGDVWAEMQLTDRARFLRHLRPWWEIHRHRMAAPVADRIDAAMDSGQLTLYGGRIRSFDIAGDDVTLSYRVRGTSEIRRITAARVINCSGPGADYARISHPLIRSLLDAGMVRPDPLCLGLDVTRNCALKDTKGAISGRLFAVGPVTKAAFWEMTAVPDIRRQCEYLANHLSVLAKTVRPRVEAARPPDIPSLKEAPPAAP
jgi:uncharacterized NAD(P)/FAD-binding protein YdhS